MGNNNQQSAIDPKWVEAQHSLSAARGMNTEQIILLLRLMEQRRIYAHDYPKDLDTEALANLILHVNIQIKQLLGLHSNL